MAVAHVAFDHVLLGFFVLDSVIEWLWFWPRHVLAVKSGAPHARARIYWVVGGVEWALIACVMATWILYRRPWAALRVGLGSPLRLAFGLVFAVVVIALLRAQRKAIFARPASVARLRKSLGYAEPLMPTTPGERRGFQLISMTAGICEEFFFRGFLMWYFSVWTGVALAVVLSSVFFGFGHIYLGLREVPRTGALGVVFALIVLATGSLWPAMIIHAAVDLNSGEMGYRLLTNPADGDAAPPDSPVPAPV